MSYVDRSPDDCPSCGSQQMIKVALTLAGFPSSFTMCNVCEWKAWRREGETLPLGSVLTLVSTH
jgi:hypothetical protein